MPYSLFQVVRDGPLTLPRWGHHLVKVATGAAFTLPVWWLATSFVSPQAALGAGLGSAVASFLVAKSFWIRFSGVRTTWRYSGLKPFTLDFGFDATLNLIPWLLLAHVGWPVWAVVGALLLLYPFARP